MISISDRINGCFLGKSIGGTLGMPFEGVSKFMDVQFYSPVPTESVANDDLDLQLVWLHLVRQHGADLNRTHLAAGWLKHIDAHFDEYGVALKNIKLGLRPPETGYCENYFACGMGAAIRSEIWAALFPGRPQTAAWFAFQDASVDHAGDGVYAEIFLAALESGLFGEQNLTDATNQALGFLPESSKLRNALLQVCKWHAAGICYGDVRAYVMRDYGSHNFTDCIMNLAFIMVGLLYGEGDFGRSVLMAVNCGQDADCTGATVGACMGIMLGSEGIPEHWKAPIGDTIVVGDYIKGIKAPATVLELSNELLDLHGLFEGHVLPVATEPVELPAPISKINNIKWRINHNVVDGGALPFRVSEHINGQNGIMEISTRVMAQNDYEAQLLICSEGVFKAYLDGQNLGTWGARVPVLPAFHRVQGGRVYNVRLQKGHTHEVKIELYGQNPMPDIWLAIADMNNRYITDLCYVE